MSYIKAPDAKDQKYYDFLEELRQSGDTNMLHAMPYLLREFGELWIDQGTEIHRDWMHAHKDSSRIISDLRSSGK